MRSIFLKKGIPIFSIKLGQRLPKSFSQLHVKNSRFFLLYFLKKDDWLKAYAGPRVPTLPYIYQHCCKKIGIYKQCNCTKNPKVIIPQRTKHTFLNCNNLAKIISESPKLPLFTILLK